MNHLGHRRIHGDRYADLPPQLRHITVRLCSQQDQVVWSNLKIGPVRLVHNGPKTPSPWPDPRMPRCMVGSRNTQRQTQRRDGDCGLERYHASSFGPTPSLRQIRCFLGIRRRPSSSHLGGSRRTKSDRQVAATGCTTPNAKRCMFLFFSTSVVSDHQAPSLASPSRPFRGLTYRLGHQFSFLWLSGLRSATRAVFPPQLAREHIEDRCEQ